MHHTFSSLFDCPECWYYPTSGFCAQVVDFTKFGHTCLSGKCLTISMACTKEMLQSSLLTSTLLLLMTENCQQVMIRPSLLLNYRRLRCYLQAVPLLNVLWLNTLLHTNIINSCFYHPIFLTKLATKSASAINLVTTEYSLFLLC